MPADTSDDAPFHGSDRGFSLPSGTGDLSSVLVRYDAGADRRTIYPDDADEFERMTRWISADDDAFIDLAETR